MTLGLSNPLIESSEKRRKVSLLVDYVYSNLGHHEAYAIKFFLCEILNFFNVIGNFLFMDAFLGGMFLNFGFEVARYLRENEELRTDPLITLFPRVTKCSFLMYGYSGTVEKHDLMCVLALNILNEKIYIFLWFWFIILGVLSSLSVLFRLLVIGLTPLRIGLLQKRLRTKKPEGFMNALSRNLKPGDAFVLQLLGKNIDILAFSSVVEELHQKFIEDEQAASKSECRRLMDIKKV